jgi:hypothetical protein
MESEAGRETFVSVGDVLCGAAKRCLEAEADLKVLTRHGSDPLSMACEEIANHEHDLATLLERFTRRGPGNLLETRFQYTPEETIAPRPRTVEDAIAHLVALNYQLSEHLRQLVDNIAPHELAESLDALRREVDALGRKISMISVTLRDS